MENIQLKLIKLLNTPEEKAIKVVTAGNEPFYMSLNDFRRRFVNTEIIVSGMHHESPVFNYMNDDLFIRDLTPIIHKMGNMIDLEGI